MDLTRDLGTFTECLVLCHSLCRSDRPTPEVVKFFFLLVQEYELEDVKRALMHHASTSPYPPKPSDVLDFLKGNQEDRALTAWHKVKTAIRRFGHTNSVRFDDPAIHWCLDRMGGWEKLCSTMLESEEPFREKDFIALYRMGERNATWNNVPKSLKGYHERNNLSAGFEQWIPPAIDAATGKPIGDVPALGSGETALKEAVNFDGLVSRFRVIDGGKDDTK